MVKNSDQLISKKGSWFTSTPKKSGEEKSIEKELPLTISTQAESFFQGDAVHVYPGADLHSHNILGKWCVCNPKISRNYENTVWVITHNSFDFREYRIGDKLKEVN